MKTKTWVKKTGVILLVVSLFAATLVSDPVQVRASSTFDYLNKCYEGRLKRPRVTTIGHAYLVGEDDLCTASWLAGAEKHAIYAVEPGTKIQGKVYSEQFYVNDNLDYLKDVLKNHNGAAMLSTGLIDRLKEGAQYVELEGKNFDVVACDNEWVTVYDQGYQAWSPYQITSYGLIVSQDCGRRADAFLETHPAGFYKIERSKVWLELFENEPIAANYYQSKSEIPNAGTGTVTSLVKLRPNPNEDDETDYRNTPCYALKTGAQLQVISKKLVPSQAAGSTRTFYKVAFDGADDTTQHNTTLYLKFKVPGTFYIDSRFLNFTKKGAENPHGTTLAENKSSGKINVYAEKDTSSTVVSILGKGAQILRFKGESDSTWTTVWFSGEKAYVKTSFLKDSSYKVTNISNLHIADIKNGEPIFRWNPGKNNIDYTVEVYRKTGTNYRNRVSKLIMKKTHYTSTSITIPKKYMKNSGRLVVYVWANNKNGGTGKSLACQLGLPKEVELKIINDNYISKNSVTFKGALMNSIQYATNPDFKNAKTKTAARDKYGNYGYIKDGTVGGLKPNTTYYFRACRIIYVKTAAGVRWLKGNWSKATKLKTD